MLSSNNKGFRIFLALIICLIITMFPVRSKALTPAYVGTWTFSYHSSIASTFTPILTGYSAVFSYTLNSDGTYILKVVQKGGLVNNGGLTEKGKYRIQGDKITFYNTKVTFIPEKAVSPSKKDEPQSDTVLSFKQINANTLEIDGEKYTRNGAQVQEDPKQESVSELFDLNQDFEIWSTSKEFTDAILLNSSFASAQGSHMVLILIPGDSSIYIGAYQEDNITSTIYMIQGKYEIQGENILIYDSSIDYMWLGGWHEGIEMEDMTLPLAYKDQNHMNFNGNTMVRYQLKN